MDTLIALGEAEVKRDGNKISVRLIGEQSEERAREAARQAIQPWETLRRGPGRGWQFRVDEESSIKRKRILDMVMDELDETERRVKRPQTSDYLLHLNDTVEHFLDNGALGA